MIPDSDVVTNRSFDGTTILTIYIVLLLAIPSPMVVAPFGSAGAPSAIFAVGTFFVWAWFQFQRDQRLGHGHQPVRTAALVWLLIMLVVYAHAMSSPMPPDEVSPADNGLLKLIGFTGILLVANDGIPNALRHKTLLRRLVIAVGLIAVLGLIQYVTRQLFVNMLQIPGLSGGPADWALIERNGHPRPSGTSTHPIEYGVVLTMVLPVAITYALRSPTHRWIYRGFLIVVAFSILLSNSRSAVICALVALIVLGASWGTALRLQALAALLALGAVVYVFVPGVLGAITGLFTGAAEDPSIASRTGSYELVGEFFSHSPLLGRGFGTFLPKYWILDNGYLGLLIEGGVLGLGGLLVLITAGLLAGRRARRAAVDGFDRELAQALVAAIAAGAAGLAFFDTFGFPQSAGCFFLLLGLAGALRRLTLAESHSVDAVRGRSPVQSGDSAASEARP